MDTTMRCSNEFITSFGEPSMDSFKYHMSIPDNFNVSELTHHAKFCSSTDILEMINEVQKVVDFVEKAGKRESMEKLTASFIPRMALLD